MAMWRGAGLAVLIVLLVGCTTQSTPVVPTTATEASVAVEAVDWSKFVAGEKVAVPFTANSPYLNTKPGIKMLGDAACQTCHTAFCDSYHQHPMGRSAEWTHASKALTASEAVGRNRFQHHHWTMSVERDEKQVRHVMREANSPRVYQPTADVSIGSGTHGYSFLTIAGDSVWQTPISWFRNLNGWEISPGYDMDNGGQRPIVASCLYCHVNEVEPKAGARNRYVEPVFRGQLAIGCERCHGPGELHVRERVNGGTMSGQDFTIVNPKYLTSRLQMDICRSCHLQGTARIVKAGRSEFEFRPGLPWDEFVSTYLLHPTLLDPHRSVGQFEQMELSVCYQKSAEKMTCTSCHDPHAMPKDVAGHYRAQCQKCHADRGCSEAAPRRATVANDCLKCHMPKGESTSIAHSSVTDHRILRRPAEKVRRAILPTGELSIVPYTSTGGNDRDYVLALLKDLSIIKSRDPNAETARQAIETKLRNSLQANPGDAMLWFGLSEYLAGQKNRTGAIRALEEGLKIDRENETLQGGLLFQALAAKDFTRALPWAERVVKTNPQAVESFLARGLVAQGLNDRASLATSARAAIAIHPLHPRARVLAAIADHHAGRRDEAKANLQATLQSVQSVTLRYDLQDWFTAATK
jgi:hypothetical protein